MNIATIENIAYKLAATSTANLAMEKLNIDEMIVGSSASPEMRALRQSAYLYAAEQVGAYVLDRLTGVQTSTLQSELSIGHIEAFAAEAAAWYIMQTTNVAGQIENIAGGNEYMRVVAQSVIWEIAGQVGQMVVPFVLNLV